MTPSAAARAEPSGGGARLINDSTRDPRSSRTQRMHVHRGRCRRKAHEEDSSCAMKKLSTVRLLVDDVSACFEFYHTDLGFDLV